MNKGERTELDRPSSPPAAPTQLVPGDPPAATGSAQGLWERVIGGFMGRRLIVGFLAAFVIIAGAVVSPFDWQTGWLPRAPLAVDAIPDIGDNQQIVFTQWPGRSPRDVEDQVTYPLTAALLGIPGVRTVRSSSALGFSSIYVIFDDSVEFYWSRARVLEKLNSIDPSTLPKGVKPTLGPDATALGQVFWYTLQGQDASGQVVGGWDPDELRSIQDWTVRYALQSVSGVSEVASVGGFVREYQVDVDPDALRAHGVTLGQVADAVRGSNLDVGARTLEVNGVEYVIRGLGLVKGVADIEAAVVVAREHTPLRVRDVARVALGPALRRGALDDAGAPAVGGVVVARFRENPLQVIARVKAAIAQIQDSLPKRTLEDGSVSQVRIVPFYDRTTLIKETLGTLSTALFQQILITLLVVLIMLRNLRSALLVSAAVPLGVLVAFVLMKLGGVGANIMALGGIAIAIGSMVDVSIVFVENISRSLTAEMGSRQRLQAVRRAAAEVAPAVLTSVLTTVVSFLPVLALPASDHRLFAPLVYAKTFAMLGAWVLALILLPTAAHWVLRKRPGAANGIATDRTSLFRSVFRVEHLRDWVVVALGLILCGYSWLAGAMVVVFGVFRLARPLLSEGHVRLGTRIENGLAVIAVALLLATNWLPLGEGRGLLESALFIAVVLVLVLGGFRLFEALYPRILQAVLRHKVRFFMVPIATLLFGATAWLGFDKVFGFLPDTLRQAGPVQTVAQAFPGFGREHMPPFDEGSYLYMPTTMPHASIGEGLSMLSQMDAAISHIPEVDRVVGKLGRAESALDPAPLGMIETLITYKPEYAEDESGTRVRQWRDHIHTSRDIWQEIVNTTRMPGLTSAPLLMPITARLVMLQSGMRAPLGIKLHGNSLESLEAFGGALERTLKQVPGVRKETVFVDRVAGKPYLEIDIDREAIGRYGLSVVAVQEVLQVALGGMSLTQVVDGRERYPVRVRYMREERDSFEALERVLIPSSDGAHVPLSQLAKISYVRGPQVIKSEDTFLTSYVLFDKQASVSETQVVKQAQDYIEAQLVSGKLQRPTGVSYEFAGSYQNQLRSEARLRLLIPLALAVVFCILYLQFSQVLTTVIIFSGVAVSLGGGLVLLWLYQQPWFLNLEPFGVSLRDLFRVGPVNLSVATWVGFIALAGLSTDDGVLMATYLKQRFRSAVPTTVIEVRERTLEAGMRRVRACLMTTATTLLALLPVVTSQGRGADIMLPMALPIIGGMSIALMTLFVVPALYCWVEERRVQGA